jgi:uncharacterized 2Fe-2S/4Fe-4S cluster protein (DUF4445 family)
MWYLKFLVKSQLECGADMNPVSKKEGWIRRLRPVITPPNLKDNKADVDRIIRALEKKLDGEAVTIDLPLMRKIPAFIGKHGYDLDVVLFKDDNGWQIVDIFPSEESVPLYVIAMDLGSATIVVRLIDLNMQQRVEEMSLLNPQMEIGPDILTRIHFAKGARGLEKCRSLLVSGINEGIARLREKQGIDAGSIVGMSVAGNTAMTHFLLGLDPYGLCREPYIPVVNIPSIIPAEKIGLDIYPTAPVLIFPNAGSYFGGDLIAGILSTGMSDREDISLLVDVGTNAEVVLGNREWLMACAGAAGPALEGGVARMGMMAGPGVIDRVVIDSRTGDFKITTIDNAPPVGICGSGLIDLVAQLFLAGMIDMRGRFVEKKCRGALRSIDGMKHLVVVTSQDSADGRALTIRQSDIDALLRSKAAMYTILTTITRMVPISMKDIQHIYISGTFGSIIDPKSAINIGMLPDLPLDTYRPMGNTSLAGAELALLSCEARDNINRIRDRVTYIELNVNQDFMNLFNAARFIPHTDRSLFPSVNG